jgi:hypothetical protein
VATFYDNNTDHIPVTGSNIAVERVYCIRVEDFTEAQCKRLDEIYRNLPGWVDYVEGIPCWFGADGSVPSLSASVELSGLIVSGTTPKDAWAGWDADFQRQIADFPKFEV